MKFRIAKWLWNFMDGRKTVTAYLLANSPWLAANPWLVESVLAVWANPSPANVGNFIVQVLFFIGVLDRISKNIKIAKKKSIYLDA